MTNSITVGLGGSATPNLPPGTGSAALFERLARDIPSARTSVARQAATTSAPIGKLASASGGAPGARQSAEQVKAFASTFAAQCWKDYAKAYPEAFSNRGNLATVSTTPKLVFVETQAEFNKIFGSSSDTADMMAFVLRDDPTRIYVHSANLVKYANKFGPNHVRGTISHELIHNLTHAINKRMGDDSGVKTSSSSAIRNLLEAGFSFDPSESSGVKTNFSVRQLIAEFAAEHYANKVTGVKSFSVGYTLIRATGEKLLQLVGESVFRKAVFANDPVAYSQVARAAGMLQQQNTRTNILNERNKDVAGVRAAQAAAPLGGALNAARLEKLETRFLRESKLYENLTRNFPDQLKDFDFKFLKAVEAQFKSQGISYDYDLTDASLRELSAAIRAVWASLK